MYYYVFVCLDGIPILELFLDKKYKAVENYERIDWNKIKYIILDFKTDGSKEHKVVEKGTIKYQETILTKQIIYFRIDIQKSYIILNKEQKKKYLKREINLMILAKKLFYSEPSVFFAYVKEKKLLNLKELKKLEKALEKMNAEKQILDSWKNIH